MKEKEKKIPKSINIQKNTMTKEYKVDPFDGQKNKLFENGNKTENIRFSVFNKDVNDESERGWD